MVQTGSEATDAVTDYCKDLVDIREAQKQTHFVLPHLDFDPLWTARVYTQHVEVWGKELRRAEEVLADSATPAIVTYSPEVLDDLKTAIRIAEDYLDQLIDNVGRSLQDVTSEGDPDQLTQRLAVALGQIVELQDRKDNE
jgi:hypothetical protein